MPVIAMTQEMGSLAKDIAVQLATSLGLAVMRHEVVAHVADRMQVPTSLIGRLRSGKAGLLERLTTDERSVALYTAEELFQLASADNVVLRGWGATCLLRPVTHIPCIRVTRSLAKRVEWLMGHLETDDAAFAEAEVRRSDNAHASRMGQQFGVTWGDPGLYDLVLNTDRVSVESCVAQIAQLVSRPEFAATAESRALLADMALQARVRVALKEHAATQAIDVTITSTHAEVQLSGIVVYADERQAAGEVAAGVAGVARVDNQLRVMSRSRLFTSAKY